VTIAGDMSVPPRRPASPPGRLGVRWRLLAFFGISGIEVAFYGGYSAEAGLIVRQAKERLPELDFVVPDGVGSENFRLIAGKAAEGIR
jgi:hypothetical protein